MSLRQDETAQLKATEPTITGQIALMGRRWSR
jgi:hypothetical protein